MTDIRVSILDDALREKISAGHVRFEGISDYEFPEPPEWMNNPEQAKDIFYKLVELEEWWKEVKKFNLLNGAVRGR